MFAGLCSSLHSSWCQFTKRLGFNWQPQEQCPKVGPFSNSAVIFDPGHSRNAGGLIESERESCISTTEPLMVHPVDVCPHTP